MPTFPALLPLPSLSYLSFSPNKFSTVSEGAWLCVWCCLCVTTLHVLLLLPSSPWTLSSVSRIPSPLWRLCVVEMYTWNLDNLVNQCDPDNFNKKKELLVIVPVPNFTTSAEFLRQSLTCSLDELPLPSFTICWPFCALAFHIIFYPWINPLHTLCLAAHAGINKVINGSPLPSDKSIGIHRSQADRGQNTTHLVNKSDMKKYSLGLWAR